jgi:pimeloyl-ACP methyl ester carboxylesterase
VLLVPGLMAGDRSLAILSGWLRRCGYRTHRSGLGLNVGCSRELTSQLARRLESIADRRQHRVALVGHSRGGMLARVMASRHPYLVAGVITLASPHLAPGAVHPIVSADLAVMAALRRAGLRSVMGADCLRGQCATEFWTQLTCPLPAGIPFTSLYSRGDGIVDWRACLDPAADHVEVASSHLGMTVHAEAYRIIADRLNALAPGTDTGAVPLPTQPPQPLTAA